MATSTRRSLPAGPDLREFASWPGHIRDAFIRRTQWLGEARPEQRTPCGDAWRTWLILAGRFWGKTRTGAEDMATFLTKYPEVRTGIVAPTYADARDICMEGVSGLLQALPRSIIDTWNRSLGELRLQTGAIVRLHSADKPDRMRGPNYHRIWADELAAWERSREAWDVLQMTLRLQVGNEQPRTVATTTPKPIPLLRDLVSDPSTYVTSGSTFDNAANAPRAFLDGLLRHEGTEWGRQEIYGELLDMSAYAILKRQWWRLWSEPKLPKVSTVILSLDTGYKTGEDNDWTAQTVWGLFETAIREGKRAGLPQHNAMILGAWREKLEFPDLRERVRQEYELWTKRLEGVPPDYVLIEEKGSGISLIQELDRAGIPVRPYNPGREPKDLRAHTSAHLLKDGRIWVPGARLDDGTRSAVEPISWAAPVIEECELFRGEKHQEPEDHDDFVDSCVQAWRLMRDAGWLEHSGDIEEPDDDEPLRRDLRAAPYG